MNNNSSDVLLHQNFDVLSALLSKEVSRKEELGRRVLELEEELLERATTKEVELNDLKLERVRLKSKLRRINQQRGNDDDDSLLHVYERDMDRLVGQVADLLSWESQLHVELERTAQERIKGLTGRKDSRLANLTRERVELEGNISGICADLASKRKDMRSYVKNKLFVDELAREMHALEAQVLAKQRRLEDEQLHYAAVLARSRNASESTRRLGASKARLCDERDRTNDQLVNMQLHAAAVLKDREKDRMLNRFLKKHLDQSTLDRVLCASSEVRRDWVGEGRALLAQLRSCTEQLEPRATSMFARLEAELDRQHVTLEEYRQEEQRVTDVLVDYVKQNGHFR